MTIPAAPFLTSHCAAKRLNRCSKYSLYNESPSDILKRLPQPAQLSSNLSITARQIEFLRSLSLNLLMRSVRDHYINVSLELLFDSVWWGRSSSPQSLGIWNTPGMQQHALRHASGCTRLCLQRPSDYGWDLVGMGVLTALQGAWRVCL